MSAFIIPADTRDISAEILDEEGRLRILPAEFHEHTTLAERGYACLKNGLYGLPTLELCQWLAERIAGRSAIEIGAGHGRLAEHLGIMATDNYMQHESSPLYETYLRMGQPPVHYGANVENLEALAAVKKYKPQVVIGSWITHRYNPREHWRGGNQYGPDLRAILELIEEYVLIGNRVTHRDNPLWDIPHEIFYPPGLYSRAMRERDFIAVWKGAKASTSTP